MTPDQWTLVDRLYHDASGVPASERDAWLARACAGDDLVRREVESLLAQNASMTNALDDGAMAHAMGQPRENLTGKQLGGYRFLEFIDEGGMGQVYRARDVALPRDVAVKVIAPEFANDPVRRARFRREAGILAALTHPHIAHVYAFVEAEGRSLLAMELVSGETLAATIRRGPLPLADVARYGAEIADALAEAHAADIVHRDLKPGNVMVTSRGAKVLDFGLARQETEATRTVTATAILGTPAYMAPEQATGKPVDARADLFSLGLLLYEMAAGQLPVPGASLGSVLAADPTAAPTRLSKVRKEATPALDALVSRLLSADPAARPATAAEVRDALKTLAAPAQSRGLRPTLAAAAAAALIGVSAGIWWAFIRTAPMRVEVARTEVVISSPGDKADPALSPDGTALAFSWRGESRDAPGIYLMSMPGGTPRRLTQSPTDDISPAWDPSGTRIAFVRLRPGQSQEILVVSPDGSAEETVRELEWPEWLRRNTRPLFAWTPDGSGWIVPMQDAGTSRYSLYRISNGRAPSLFAKVETSAGLRGPAFSRDGRWFTYAAQDPDAVFVRAVGPGGELEGEPLDVSTFAGEDGRRLREEPIFWPNSFWPNSPTLSPDGSQLWFAMGPRIMFAQPALRQAQVAYTAPSSLEHLTAHWAPGSSTPVMVFATTNSQYEIRRIEVSTAGPAAAGPGELLARGATPALSPDGKWLAFVSLTASGVELFLSGADGSRPRPLTRLRAVVLADPDWSADGRRLAFHARVAEVTEGRGQVYVTDVDPAVEMARAPAAPSTATTRQVTTHPVSLAGPRWAPDGQALYATQLPGRIVRVNASTGEVEEMFVGDIPRPDGASQRLYYGRDGQFGLFARSLAGDVRSNPEERILSDYVSPRGYRVTSKGIFYLGRDEKRNPVAIRFYDFALKTSVDVAPPPRGQIPEVSASPDGRYVLFDTVDEGSRALTAVQIRETRK